MWRTKKFEESIVVLGAGFAGIECAKRLQKKLKGYARVHVALVDKENYSVFQPLLPEVASANIASHHVINPVRILARDVDFDCATVEAIDLDKQIVTFRAPEGIDMLPMPYTHLVIAMGLVPNMAVVPGMAAHGLAMKTVGDAYALRNHVITQLEQAANTTDDALRKELLTFVTVGAGFSGVETCAEIHDMIKAALKYYPELRGEQPRSVLISSTSRILPQMSEKISAYSLKNLTKRGIEIRLEERVASVTPIACFLQNGDEIPTRTVISTIGNSPHPVLKATPLPQKRGRLICDEFMRVQGYDNVWSIGDCALVPNAHDGEMSPPTAQFAARQGKQCADNVFRALNDQELEPFSFRQLGYLASLGHLTAVAEMFGFIRLGGFIGWWVWRTIYLMKLPGLYRKLRVMLDWTTALLFPRDICQLNAHTRTRVGREHYEPGQDIVVEGDEGDMFYSIVDGEVEVFKADNGTSKLVARLGPGSYFGEEALLSGDPRSATVRAKTAVDVLVLGKSDFVSLTGNLSMLRDWFQQTRRPLVAAEATHTEEVRAGLAKMTVGQTMSRDPIVVNCGESLEDICLRFHQQPVRVFPVLNDDDKLVGILSRVELHEAMNNGADVEKTTTGDLLRGVEIIAANPEDDLRTTLDRFHQHEVEHMCVVDAEDARKLVGIISLTDLMQARIEVELVMRNPDVVARLRAADNNESRM